MSTIICDIRNGTITKIKRGDTVEYLSTIGDGSMTRATALDVFSNGDIRTDKDGVRCYGEYRVVEGGKNEI